MTLSSIAALLQAALLLLNTVQKPNISPSVQLQCIEVATRAISLATGAIAQLPQHSVPLTATLTAAPTSGSAPLTITFTSTPLGPGYAFNAGDGYL